MISQNELNSFYLPNLYDRICEKCKVLPVTIPGGDANFCIHCKWIKSKSELERLKKLKFSKKGKSY